MGVEGEVNLGQLAREQLGASQVFLVGFTTYTGTVTAASHWDGPAQRKRVRPALAGSVEALFHAVGIPRFLLLFGAGETVSAKSASADSQENSGTASRLSISAALREAGPMLYRAIGVIYKPATERTSHFLNVMLPDAYDAIIHIDETRAVEPLRRLAAEWQGDEEETYPSGL